MTQAEDVAAILRKALADGTVGTALAPYMAETVALHHHPATTTDGPMGGDVLVRMMGNPPTGALVDPKRTTESVEVDGDRIAVRSVLTGALADGEIVRVPNTAVYTIRDGLVVRIDSHYEPAAMADLRRAMTGGAT